MENIDVFVANLNFKDVVERKEAHIKGMWHQTFHCWVVNPKNKSILFQLRSKEKKNYPDMFDISAAGHLLSGEKGSDGIREVSEELGIDLDFDSLYSLGYRVEVDDQENGQMNREYQDVYIASVDEDLSRYTPQKEEVSGLMWMKIDDALSLFSNAVNRVMMNGIVYNKDKMCWDEVNREVCISDFIPRIQKYYLTIAIMSERVLKNQFPVSIS